MELLAAIAKRNVLHIFLTITTLNEPLARLLEPYAPRPSLRLGALRKLSGAGVRVAVLASPIMPLINDSSAQLMSIGRAVSDAGAAYLTSGVLFLKPCAQKAFFPLLEKHFPHLLRRYQERYQREAYLSGHYPEMIAKRIEDVRRRYGLKERPERYQPEQWKGDPQLELFGP